LSKTLSKIIELAKEPGLSRERDFKSALAGLVGLVGLVSALGFLRTNNYTILLLK
jgi:hypothetical protein